MSSRTARERRSTGWHGACSDRVGDGARPRARAILRSTEVGHHLGVAIGSLINVFNPQLVVIGGGFGVAAFDLLLPAARPAVEREALAPGGRGSRSALPSSAPRRA